MKKDGACRIRKPTKNPEKYRATFDTFMYELHELRGFTESRSTILKLYMYFQVLRRRTLMHLHVLVF